MRAPASPSPTTATVPGLSEDWRAAMANSSLAHGMVNGGLFRDSSLHRHDFAFDQRPDLGSLHLWAEEPRERNTSRSEGITPRGTHRNNRMIRTP